MALKQYYVAVEGTSCQGCALAINTFLNEHPQVVEGHFSFSSKCATIALEDNVSIGTILAALQQEHPKFKCTQVEFPFKTQPSQSESQFKKGIVVNALACLALLTLGYLGLMPVAAGLGQWWGLSLSAMSLAGMLYTGHAFYADAWVNLRRGKTNMNTLVSLSTLSAWVFSTSLFTIPSLFVGTMAAPQLMAIHMILGIVNLGRFLRAKAENKALSQSQNMANIYFQYQPQRVKKLKRAPRLDEDFNALRADELEEISFKEVEPGDIIRVRKDERFPTEGEIINDVHITVNQENIRGESTPVGKRQGSQVFSGTKNLGETVYIRATCRGAENNLQKILSKVAGSDRATPPSIIDRISKVFVPGIIGLSIAAPITWKLFAASMTFPAMFNMMNAILLCACPCALGLAAPISMALSVSALMKKGILIKDADLLEKVKNIDVVVFDKTGTLTEPSVQESHIKKDFEMTDMEIANILGSLEKHAGAHPIAQAFQRQARDISLPFTHVRTAPQGVYGEHSMYRCWVGSKAYLDQHDIFVHEDVENHQFDGQGYSDVYCCILHKDGFQIFGKYALAHQVRDEAKQTVQSLQASGKKVVLLTGDNQGPAQVVAQTLGINEVYAENNSADKKARIEALQNHHGKRRIVAMVGDGINDLEAMEAADVSFAIDAWVKASAKADISLRSKLSGILHSLDIAKATLDNVQQNVYWALGYNAITLAMASGLVMGVLGVGLPPVVASMLMMGSSLVVVGNALRLPGIISQRISDDAPSVDNETEADVGFWHSPLHYVYEHVLGQSPKQSVEAHSAAHRSSVRP